MPNEIMIATIICYTSLLGLTMGTSATIIELQSKSYMSQT